MPFKLTSTDGTHSFELRAGAPLVVGRAPEQRHPDHRSDHLAAARGGREQRHERHGARPRVEQRDVRQRHARRQRRRSAPATSSPSARSRSGSSSRAATQRARAQQPRLRAAGRDDHSPALPDARRARAPRTSTPTRRAGRSSRPCSRSPKASAGPTDIDTLLDKIVRYAYQILEVDRVAILLRRRGRRAASEDCARQTRRRQRARRAAVDRADGAQRQGRHPLRQRRRGHALRRPVDPHAADPLGDLRAAHRQRGARRSAFCTSTT